MKGLHFLPLQLVSFIVANIIIVGEGSIYNTDIIEKYAAFKNRYAIDFASIKEDAYRLEVFRENLEFVEKTNERNLSYTLEINEYSAMTHEEFASWMSSPNLAPAHYVRLSQKNRHYPTNNSLGTSDYKVSYPSDLNWAERGAVNTPIHQGRCRSCYAIGTLGAVEAGCWAKTGYLPNLSVQQVVDCSLGEGNSGCMGGYSEFTLNYIGNNGVVSDEDYPYEAKGQKCKDVVGEKTKQYLKPGDLKLENLRSVNPQDLRALFERLQNGPLVIRVHAATPEWQLYKGGILKSFDCQGDPSHAVLLVGYGVENGESYWIIRNSWGTEWGEGGYARLIRDPHATQGPGFCNILSMQALQVTFLTSPNVCPTPSSSR